MKRKLVTTIILLAFWQILAILINKPIIIPYPISVFTIMFKQLNEPSFYKTVYLTLSRVFIGLLIASLLGLVLGFFSGLSKKIEEYLSVVINMIKAIPNVCYMVIILLWFGSEISVTIITFFIIFPNIYSNVVLGIKSLPFDQKLINMVYPAPLIDLIIYVYWPQVLPYYLSSIKTALSLGLKVSVMAEIVGAVNSGIGKKLSYAKAYLETDEIFAWTIWIIIISMIIESLFEIVERKQKGAN